VKKERFNNKNNVLSVMMLVNIVLKNQMIIVQHVMKHFFLMKQNVNNVIVDVNNVSKIQIIVYPVKKHSFYKKKHVNYVMLPVKIVLERRSLIVFNVKRSLFFIMDNVNNNVQKQHLTSKAYVVRKIV